MRDFPPEIRTQIIGLLDDKSIIALGHTSRPWRALLLNHRPSLQFTIFKSLKHDWKIFGALELLRKSPGRDMGLCLLVLSAQIPRLYLKREEDSDTETGSDETDTESAGGSGDDTEYDFEDDAEDDAEDETEDDCSMPSLDDLGFIDIQPQLDDGETEMLELIWSLTSCKRRYYDQEGLVILRRILATEGAKLFFIDSKRLSLRHQMLKTVAKGWAPTERQFMHLILVFWAKIEVIELANDLLQKEPNLEQERILHYLKNSKELDNPEDSEWLDKAISECKLTWDTSKQLQDFVVDYCGFQSFKRLCAKLTRADPRFKDCLHSCQDPTLFMFSVCKAIFKTLEEGRDEGRSDRVEEEERDLIGRG